LKCKKVDDFFYAVTSAAEWGPLMQNIKDINAVQQTARVRQAWVGLFNARKEQDELRKKRVDSDDLDPLLAQGDLDTIQDRVWARYHQVWAPDQAPADVLVSRVVRELEKRLLSVRDVWKVRNQTVQLKAKEKRTDVGDGLVFVQEEKDQEKPVNRNVQNYLDLHYTMCLAYVFAGAKRVTTASLKEERTADSTAFVEVPLDVVMKYHRRVVTSVRKVKQPLALHWLEQRDIAEREVWVEKVRNSSCTLGQIIKDTYERREAMWAVEDALAVDSKVAFPMKRQTDDEPANRDMKRQRVEQSHPQPKVTGKAKDVMKSLKNGKLQ
jgi:hypothetical protein